MLPDNATNYTLFRDCFSSAFLQRVSLATNTSKPRKKRATKSSKRGLTQARDGDHPATNKRGAPPNDKQHSESEVLADDLAEFIEFLASETFAALPDDVQELSYSQLQADAKLTEKWIEIPSSDLIEDVLPLIPSSVTDSLDTYSLLAPGTSFGPLLGDALAAYLNSISSPPPVWSSTRAEECEVCGRGWVPLTYHHLIPKEAQPKALKRGWHEEWVLNSVAWLCRACHSYVHRVASNEELAKDFFTIEKLLQRSDIQGWAQWVGRVRWRAR